MSDTTTVAIVTPLRSASLDMARSVLMGVGTPLLARGLVTTDNWQAIVGGLLALASAIWSYLAAHPSKTPLIQTALSLVRDGGQSKAWNNDLTTMEAAMLPMVEKIVDEKIHAKAGVLAVPLDGVANAAIREAAANETRGLKIS